MCTLTYHLRNWGNVRANVWFCFKFYWKFTFLLIFTLSIYFVLLNLCLRLHLCMYPPNGHWCRQAIQFLLHSFIHLLPLDWGLHTYTRSISARPRSLKMMKCPALGEEKLTAFYHDTHIFTNSFWEGLKVVFL